MRSGRIWWTVLLIGVLATGGCVSGELNPDDYLGDPFEDVHTWRDFAGELILIGAVYSTVAIIDAAHDASMREEASAPPSRLLQAVEGSVCDKDGRAIEGVTLVARDAGRYRASPERLPATTVRTGADGTFTLLMAKTDAVCVDFAAEGMRPMRRWFVVDSPGVSATLPKDRTEILLVTPYAHLVRVVPTGLVMETQP